MTDIVFLHSDNSDVILSTRLHLFEYSSSICAFLYSGEGWQLNGENDGRVLIGSLFFGQVAHFPARYSSLSHSQHLFDQHLRTVIFVVAYFGLLLLYTSFKKCPCLVIRPMFMPFYVRVRVSSFYTSFSLTHSLLS